MKKKALSLLLAALLCLPLMACGSGGTENSGSNSQQNQEDERMKAMIENFDRALEHPDQEDLERLRLAVEKL